MGQRFYFPAWTNRLAAVSGVIILFGSVYVVAVGAYGTSPKTTNVGYSPEQPIPFSHKLHAGKLKMDCR